MVRTRLEAIVEEAVRPMVGAMKVLLHEIEETMQIPDSPWKILNKSYDQLSEQEIMALADIYHIDGELTPCPFCQWVSREELKRARQDKEQFGV